ncbi:Uncharacterized protein dnm_041510 [Desulfonema magnum]|uniref:Uncharacterized protein n=1 Tax=Desulfonema magnum TaxID=45655 RepID=A0A975GNT2_9BACT|nr:Uncharacterized protein dnm_041510 [Desulfonema magnum]
MQFGKKHSGLEDSEALPNCKFGTPDNFFLKRCTKNEAEINRK